MILRGYLSITILYRPKEYHDNKGTNTNKNTKQRKFCVAFYKINKEETKKEYDVNRIGVNFRYPWNTADVLLLKN